jgi:hypothetical protein
MLPLSPLLRRASLVAVLACASPAAAQDLGLVEGIFQEVSAVTVYYQTGGVPGSREVSSGALHGAGSEVLINLKSEGGVTYELGLGASFLRGYRADEPSLDLRASLRALPTISLYVTRDALPGPFSAYLGGSFGLIELWNAQAYGPSGQPWDVQARTFELGGSLGLYLNRGALTGLFVEGGYRSRDFHAVRWESRGGEELPLTWPRSLDFSGPLLSVGWQVQLGTAGEDEGSGG